MARILVVEDDDLQRRLLCDFLADAGHETRGCGNPGAAFELVEKETPDLAILDYLMPGMTGAELLAELSARGGGRRFPVVFLSGTEAIRFAARVVPGTDVRFLQKPLDMERLAATISDLLDRDG
jgi:CheY-like chemotaxis protein